MQTMKTQLMPLSDPSTSESNLSAHGRKTFLTVREVASYLRVSVSTIRNRIREGAIPCKRVYGRVLFDLAEINAWVAAHNELDRLVRGTPVPDSNRRTARHVSELPVVFTLD